MAQIGEVNKRLIRVHHLKPERVLMRGNLLIENDLGLCIALTMEKLISCLLKEIHLQNQEAFE